MMCKDKYQEIISREEAYVNRIEKLYQEMLDCRESDYSLKIAVQITEMQSEDGAWSAIEIRHCDSDIVVDFTYYPTYYATAALMKCEILNGVLPETIAAALHRGLEYAQGRKLNGSGYEATEGRLKALNIYKQAGLYSWMLSNEKQEPEFCEMIKNIIEGFRAGLATGHTFSDWNRDFSHEFEKEVNEYDEVAHGGSMSRTNGMSMS